MRGGERVPGTVVVEDGVIVELCFGRRLSEPWARTYDLPGALVLAGLIDLHVHGGGGFAAADGREHLRRLGAWLAARGVTGFLASVPSRPQDELCSACRAVAEAASAGDPPNLLGLHLEGPFLSPERAGSLPAGSFRQPSPLAYRSLRAVCGSWLKVLTIAPELPGAGEVIAACRRDGVVAAMGHTNAGFDEARAGLSSGMAHVTHLFNAMSPFHHRAPGAVGAALTSETATAELILDGEHVHPAAMALARSAMGASRLIVVSDALPVAGTARESSLWEGREVFRRGPRLVFADGTLAGSAVSLNEALATAIGWGLEPAEAVAMASANPAAVLGLEGRKGRLVPGQDADLVVMDKDWRALLTLVRGRRVWPDQRWQD